MSRFINVMHTHSPDAAREADVIAIDELRALNGRICAELGKVIIGQHSVIEELLICIFARGHALLMGVPGLAKTLLVHSLADLMSMTFSRVQFTPDLMPSDVLGTSVFQQNKADFEFRPGPIFASVVLIDEINRAPAKTQSALIEVMEERTITQDGTTYTMAEPFLVLATQNPIEQEGTYPLPEAQLDRFMFMTLVRYPTPVDEIQIMKQATSEYHPSLSRMLDAERIMQLQTIVKRVPVAEHVYAYARDLVRATRPGELGVPPYINDMVQWGAGPRASIYLILAGKARAILQGRVHVTTEDIVKVAHPVLRHRILTTFSAEAAGINSDKVIDRLLKEVPRTNAEAA